MLMCMGVEVEIGEEAEFRKGRGAVFGTGYGTVCTNGQVLPYDGSGLTGDRKGTITSIAKVS